MTSKLRVRQKLGKYRIERRLGEGGFASVFQAYDTIEGVRVALKVPHPQLVDAPALSVFRREVKVNAQLDHPNVLPIKYAGFIDERFVIVYPLGLETLEDRLGRRMALRRALHWFEQMLDAVAFAHRRKILHSDVKPENFILFPGDRLRLADFGLARVSHRTMTASGSGTVGYLAPEQAMGRPSLRSDVFALGLIFYRMITGALPEWPFDWPPPAYDRLREKLHPDMIRVLERALEVDHRRRFRDAVQLRAAFRRVRHRAANGTVRRRRRRRSSEGEIGRWKAVRFREFQARYRARLDTRHDCGRCGGPVSEAMQACPWCGAGRPKHAGATRFPARCPRCRRGRKLDWRFCPWCYGGAFKQVADREYTDARYEARCANPACRAKRLMPFMRYCPACNRKVQRRWTLPASKTRCPRCDWGVLPEVWTHCPWCRRRLSRS